MIAVFMSELFSRRCGSCISCRGVDEDRPFEWRRYGDPEVDLPFTTFSTSV
jgi:hypothetical protein